MQASEQHKAESWMANTPLQSFRVVARSRLFSLLAVVASLSYLVQMGVNSVLPQFLQLTLKYTKSDMVRSYTGRSLPTSVGYIHSDATASAYAILLLLESDVLYEWLLIAQVSG